MAKVSTLGEIAAEIADRIKYGETVLHMAGVVRETARKMEGQRVTKRFGTAVAARAKEVMGEGWVFHWQADDWGQRLYAWQGAQSGPIGYKDRLSFRIGRGAHPGMRDPMETINEAWIVAENIPYFNEAERLSKLRDALNHGKPAEWAEKIAEMQRFRAQIDADATAYGCQYLLTI